MNAFLKNFMKIYLRMGISMKNDKLKNSLVFLRKFKNFVNFRAKIK